jgi:hypothetical protein
MHRIGVAAMDEWFDLTVAQVWPLRLSSVVCTQRHEQLPQAAAFEYPQLTELKTCPPSVRSGCLARPRVLPQRSHTARAGPGRRYVGAELFDTRRRSSIIAVVSWRRGGGKWRDAGGRHARSVEAAPHVSAYPEVRGVEVASHWVAGPAGVSDRSLKPQQSLHSAFA